MIRADITEPGSKRHEMHPHSEALFSRNWMGVKSTVCCVRLSPTLYYIVNLVYHSCMINKTLRLWSQIHIMNSIT